MRRTAGSTHEAAAFQGWAVATAACPPRIASDGPVRAVHRSGLPMVTRRRTGRDWARVRHRRGFPQGCSRSGPTKRSQSHAGYGEWQTGGRGTPCRPWSRSSGRCPAVGDSSGSHAGPGTASALHGQELCEARTIRMMVKDKAIHPQSGNEQHGAAGTRWDRDRSLRR